MTREVSGSPIDGALLRLVEALEGNTGTFRNLHPRVCEIPFNPIIKFHLTIHEAHDFQANGYLVNLHLQSKIYSRKILDILLKYLKNVS